MSSRDRLLVFALSLLGLPACVELAAPSPRRIQRALGSEGGPIDATPARETAAKDLAEAGSKASCGSITSVGCCDGETLWWCEQGTLKHIACGLRPRCGWSSTGKFHDCNTSGASDPANLHAKECLLVTDASLPKTDTRSVDGGGDCRGVTIDGCCDGNTLLYCVDGVLRALHCGLNPSCGWLANGQFYDCGTEGLQDPKGVIKKACPIAAPDGLGVGLRDASGGEPTRELGPDLGGDAGGKDGCSCSLGAAPAGGLWLLWFLGLGLALGARRRSR